MTSKILKGLALSVLLASCSADENVGLAKGVGDNAGNAVYMGNKNASGVISVLASDADGASFSVTPRLAVATDKDVQVTVEVDAATLAAYNKANNLNVTAISPDDVVFTAEDGSQSKGKVTARREKCLQLCLESWYPLILKSILMEDAMLSQLRLLM